jgi:putative tricarboxylic transport membrane protein
MGSKNLIAALALLALAAWYGVLTANLPERTIPNTPGPSFFPWIITISLALLSAALLVRGVKTARRGEALVEGGRPARLALAGLAWFAIYLAVMPTVGFPLASVPFFAGLMWLYGERRPLWIAAGSLALPVILYLVFRDMFQILLPPGLLEMIGG